MKKKQICNLLLLSIFLIYLERDTACRGLCSLVDDIYNNSVVSSFYWFLRPYFFLAIIYFAFKLDKRWVIVPIVLGVLFYLNDLYNFISMEYWQYINFDNYVLFTKYDSYELRSIFDFIVYGFVYILSLSYWFRNLRKSK